MLTCSGLNTLTKKALINALSKRWHTPNDEMMRCITNGMTRDGVGATEIEKMLVMYLKLDLVRKHISFSHFNNIHSTTGNLSCPSAGIISYHTGG